MVRSTVVVTIGLLFLVFIVSVGFFFGKTKRVTPSPITQQTTTTEVTAFEVLTSLQKELQVTQELVPMHQNWFSEALDREIPLTGQYFGLKAAESSLLADYTVTASSGTVPYEIRSAGLVTLKNVITDFFSVQSFQKNGRNSQRDEASYSLDETLAFEKGELACLVSVRTLDPVGTFFCGRYDQAYEAQRNEFIPVLNPTNDPDIFVEVSVVEGNYAKGGTGGGGGGGVGWYAVKEGGTWKVVDQSQNDPPCSVMEKYDFPQTMYTDCRPDQ